MIVAASTGLYKSTNYGASWNKTISKTIYDVKFQPGSNRLYAASSDSLYYSTDAGDTWIGSSVNVTLSGVRRIELAVSPGGQNVVYALLGDVDALGTFDGILRSTNAGISYTQQATSPNILGRATDGSDLANQASYDLALAVSLTNANRVVSGGIRLWNSSDGAATFTYLGGTHADIHDLAYNPLDNKLYACTDGGVYVSDDNGSTWTALMTSFANSQLYNIAWTPEDDEFILAGFQDNGIKLKSANGSHYDDISGGDGFDVSFYGGDKTRFYTTINRGVFKYSNNGASRSTITPPGGPDTTAAGYDWYGTVRAHNNNNNIVLVGYDDVFVSTDDGATYTNTGATGSWALETCPSNSNKVYAAGDTDFDVSNTGSLWRSDSLGFSGWIRLDNNPGFPISFTKITDIAVSPTNSNNILVTIGGFTDGVKVYRSLNGGSTWSDWTGSLPNMPINCAAIASGGSDYYIGTDLGVFYRNTNMNDWMPFSNGLPVVPISEILVNTNQEILLAATFGRGVWKTDIPTTCVASLILNNSLKGQYHYEADNFINTTSSLIGGVGTELSLKSAGRIVLLPGFRARRLTKLNAYIGQCGEGGIPD